MNENEEPPCQCPGPGYCPRYQIEQQERPWQLCQSCPEYRAKWRARLEARTGEAPEPTPTSPPAPPMPTIRPAATYLINLARRPDRLAQADEQFRREGIPYIRVEAVDGHALPLPDGWQSGAGAYGCWRSHVEVLRLAAAAGHECIQVLEDDAVLCDGYREKLPALLDAVTALDPDWQHVFPGGQHMEAPIATADPGIVRAVNVHRTHAYVTRDVAGLLRMWMDINKHVDHIWGVEQKEQRVYCPLVWQVAQGAGVSDVNGRMLGHRSWAVRRVVDEFKKLPAPRKGCGCSRRRGRIK